jgi:glyoxylase-like metal-dependent hydrolase (beta-lactamase superfamily II)
VKIHAIQTGHVTIHSRQTEGVGHGNRRVLNTLFDRKWTEPLPIYAYAIEHPEGVIVVDTGETARVMQPGYFPRWHPYPRFAVRMDVAPEQEIGPQLRELGIEAGDVRTVVVTHLHTDHAGGLHHFPGAEVLVSGAEIDFAAGFAGRVRGYPNNRWPDWFAPTRLDLPDRAYGPFPNSMPLTAAGDVTIVGLAGHTPGHIGVVVDEGEQRVFLAGDTSYNQELMLRGVLDGVAPDEKAHRLTTERTQAFVRERPTVYLVAHDPETGLRLAERRMV